MATLVKEPPLISITARVAHAFDVKTMLAGFRLYSLGMAVTLTEPKAIHVELNGVERDGARANLTLRVNRSTNPSVLHIECSCAKGAPCAHAWGALLYLDELGDGPKCFRESKKGLRVHATNWRHIEPRICDSCPRAAVWEHPKGGARCGTCKRPENGGK